MTEEKKIILEKINALINKKKAELLQKMPLTHKIDDGMKVIINNKARLLEDYTLLKILQV